MLAEGDELRLFDSLTDLKELIGLEGATPPLVIELSLRVLAEGDELPFVSSLYVVAEALALAVRFLSFSKVSEFAICGFLFVAIIKSIT